MIFKFRYFLLLTIWQFVISLGSNQAFSINDETFFCVKSLLPKFTLGLNGPVYKFRSNEYGLTSMKKSIADLKKLKISTYNVANLYQSPHFSYAKTEAQRQGIKNAIVTQNPDILIILESNFEELRKFVETELGNIYFVNTIYGNEENGNGMSLLIRRNLMFDIDIYSNRNYQWNNPHSDKLKLLHTRDQPAYVFKYKGKAQFSIIAVHNKSQENREMGDNLINVLQNSQIFSEGLVAQEISRMYGANVPIYIVGDQNVDIREDSKFGFIKSLGFKDAFDFKNIPKNSAERITHRYLDWEKKVHDQQLDGIAVQEKFAHDLLSISQHHEKYSNGNNALLPLTPEEKDHAPSDHAMITAQMRFRLIP